MIAWSHSRVAEFIKCPYKFWGMQVRRPKVEFRDTKATLEGKKIHKMLEERVRDGKAFPPEYQYLEKIAAPIIAAPGDKFVETQLALDDAFSQCGWKDWKRAWVRAIADILIINSPVAWIGDYKTGNPENGDEHQLMLSAGVLFQVFPEIQRVTTGYIWTKLGEIRDEDFKVYHRDEMGPVWDILLARYAPLHHASETNEWPKLPEKFKCAYCEVNRDGLCDKAASVFKGR